MSLKKVAIHVNPSNRNTIICLKFLLKIRQTPQSKLIFLKTIPPYHYNDSKQISRNKFASLKPKINMLNAQQALLVTQKNKCMLSINCQSFNKSHLSIKNLVKELQLPQILLLQEIWHPKINTSIANYQKPIIRTRANRKGGGLAAYFRNDINFKENDELNSIKTTEIEKLAVTIKGKKPFVIMNIYRPPNSNTIESLKELEKLLVAVTNQAIPFTLIGDLNVDLATENYISKRYTDLLQTFNCIQIVKLPTRISSYKKSLIDHCICSNDFILNSNVLEYDISDHLPLLINWDLKREKDTYKTSKITKINYKKLIDNLNNKKLNPLETLSSNEAFNALHEHLTTAIENSKYETSRKNTPNKPYISEKTVKVGRTVEMLRKKFLKNNSIDNEYRYKVAKREHQSLVRREKNNFYKTKLENCKGDSKKTWRIINEVLSRNTEKLGTICKQETLTFDGKNYSTNSDISNHFNSFYRDIAMKIAKNISSSISYNFFLRQSYQPLKKFELIEATDKDILRTVANLSNKTSTGPHGISNKTLKQVTPHIIKELTICINKSLEEETFPELLKVSKITPLHKKGDKSSPNNYRPIAQLSPFSKLFEQICMTQMTEFFDRENVLTSKQFGFRKSHSTIHPLINVKHYIEKKVHQQKEYVILISLDLSKAFDCVDTDKILQNKLRYYTQNDKLTNWVDSFYRNRRQYTTWEDRNSNLLNNHNISIVQGSSMGPKLFNVYLNDLPYVSEYFEMALFADDSNFLLANKNIGYLETLVNKELTKVKSYFDSNGLSINTSKTTYLMFCPKNKQKVPIKIILGDIVLQESEYISFLGIHIDNKLSFKQHYLKVYDKVKNGLNGLILTKHKLTYRAKMNIYNSLMHSHLSYGALIWISNINAKQLKSLATLQKKAMRIIFNTKYNAHTNNLFFKSKITKVKDIFEKESILLIHKYKNNNLPAEIQNLITNNIQTEKINTRSTYNNDITLKRTNANNNMIVSIMDNWNKNATWASRTTKIGELKKLININLNVWENCETNNCYICNK